MDVETNGDADAGGSVVEDIPVSPTTKTALAVGLPPSSALESLNMRADPDAQATVTDYLDFTEYLPADVNRSLTLIGKLDQTYIDASMLVHELTTTWGKLPSLPSDQRPVPAELRADISRNLAQAVNSRISSHAEAQRMSEYVNRHVNRAKTILAKLQHMHNNYPTEEQKSPIQTRSPQLTRTPKVTLPLDKDGNRIRRPPRITVPGEVLAPYDVDFNAYSSSSEESSEEEEYLSPTRSTPAPRIKLVKGNKVPKQKIPKPPRPSRQPLNDGLPIPSTSSALAKLKPPPEDAVIGGVHLPWLQLTPYELAKLRKRMKKNAVWSPSDTMIARELKSVGRGVEAYKQAQQKAKDEGKPFDAALPTLVTDTSGAQHPPVGAISTDALGADEVKLSNRGMKLNEAKKLKREQMAKQAADEAEESARKMKAMADKIKNYEGSPSIGGSAAGATNPQPAQPVQPVQPAQPAQPAQTPAQTPSQAQSLSKPQPKKRKRDSLTETAIPEIKTESQENSESTPAQPVKPPIKRTKTETPVPPPQLTPRPTSVPPVVATHVPPPQIAQPTVQVTSTTPVPVPIPPTSQVTSQVTPQVTPQPTPQLTPQVPSQASSQAAEVPEQPAAQEPSQATAQTSQPIALTSVLPERPTASPSTGSSPAPAFPSTVATTTTVPTKPPAMTPILPPKISTTPILPPANNLTKRETRKDAQKTIQPIATNTKQPSLPRQNTPVTTPGPDQPSMNLRRPSSRGQGSSVEPPTTLAADRPRRASTARNTPAPEIRQPSKRIKRPAPGVVNKTSTGGASAIGKRSAAPRKRQRVKKGTQTEQEPEVEVDDEGNIIDPDEPRYCLCNGVSFGTMIQCDNVDNCKQEWFHLECVGLTEIPARTTKWYCPDCRVLLNIGGRGEVTSRGVKL
ncbi:hypothetical protein LQW54_002576 [Pestalotiopsis sp. IQ-011]